MTEKIEASEAERHRAKMAKRKVVQDKEVAGKTIEKGLLIVHTAPARGNRPPRSVSRSACSAGGGASAWCNSSRAPGTRPSATRSPSSAISCRGTRWARATWETQDRARDVAAERAWEKAQELIADPSFSLVVLDELNIALRYDYLDLNRVLETLAARRPIFMSSSPGGTPSPSWSKRRTSSPR